MIEIFYSAGILQSNALPLSQTKRNIKEQNKEQNNHQKQNSYETNSTQPIRSGIPGILGQFRI